ncbi:IucA/IucC family protein [Paenibacillus senegalimassiliensis]|uniref:IucA/IucC family protein n=1 Tax=Paenibacillus senegalimassiliensis TaxID=1737426 RepID=UPI00073E242B|nr:IucA/IucC family protein [Paenibacillus senegalimassiliensis]
MGTETKSINTGRKAAQVQVMADLLNTLLSERFFEPDERTLLPITAAPEHIRGLFSDSSESTHTMVYVAETAFLLKENQRTGLQWVQDTPIFKQERGEGWSVVTSPEELADVVLRSALTEDAYAQPGVADFLAGLKLAVQQLALSLNPAAVQRLLDDLPNSPYGWFIRGEQVAALRDRPFHPSSKAKVGFSDQDYEQYSAEFGKPVRLRWVALRADTVERGTEQEEWSCLDLLGGEERSRLESELQQRGLTPGQYVPLPVHPWQLQQVILPRFDREIAEGTIVVLDTEGGDFLATSSLRSLSPASLLTGQEDEAKVRSIAMLKLPVSVLSLGAARYLPVVKLLNGLAGEKLLRQAVLCDDTLADRVFLCEERHFWGYMPREMGLFDDHPRHLAAQIRLYPAALFAEGYRVIPMAALGVEREGWHMLPELLGRRLSSEEVISFYRELAYLFYDVVMRLFKIGVMPEIHGQNCCLVLEHGRPRALLFRDHDSVRLHPPYLDKHGIGDPKYHIRPGYSNSLYNETIHKLIFYVQSLGTQLNLGSIIEALSRAYELESARFWEITELAWKSALQTAGLPEEDQEELFRAVFAQHEWPTKLVIRPLLEAEGVPGAMPSGKGLGHNPFWR